MKEPPAEVQTKLSRELAARIAGTYTVHHDGNTYHFTFTEAKTQMLLDKITWTDETPDDRAWTFFEEDRLEDEA